MNATIGIEWTDATSNPFKFRDKATGQIVWACVKTSPGCAHCYSESLAKRYGRGGPFTRAEMAKVDPFVCEKELKQLLTSKKLAGKRVFVGDMTDLFGEWVTNDMLDKLFHTLEQRRDATFQLLTKRADRMREYLSWRWGEGRIPSRHIHVGTSVEDQQRADERIPELLKVPAAVRFLSVEPLLGPVDLSRWMLPKSEGQDFFTAMDAVCGHVLGRPVGPTEYKPGIDWVIVGGESGPGARPFQIEWARSLRDQCKAAGVAYFLKQLGAVVEATGAIDPIDQFPGKVNFRQGRDENTARISLIDKKGGDMEEWPEDLRVRQFPEVARG